MLAAVGDASDEIPADKLQPLLDHALFLNLDIETFHPAADVGLADDSFRIKPHVRGNITKPRWRIRCDEVRWAEQVFERSFTRDLAGKQHLHRDNCKLVKQFGPSRRIKERLRFPSRAHQTP